MSRNKLYLSLSILLTLSYIYVGWSLTHAHNHNNFTVCIFKNATGIACPSCGSTRAVLLLAQGHIAQAGLMNPMGYTIALFMITTPFWLLYDFVLKKNTLYTRYKAAEKVFSAKWLIGLLILLVCLNWAWNIQKGL
ncbi:DUF2752 domain-containing protein [Flavobacterium sp. RHBU_3]|uniref:DUF2752 domain-containing protein n=1 Tax=Flavobacterium sp. RHBU_3 TaxID=3391184 RepID=UPI00398543E4